jgi:thioredoxin reductase (NADPH)
MSVTQIKNKQEFLELAKSSNDYYVLDFYADWCGPCKMMLPVFERVSKNAEVSNFKFAKINRDENQDLVDEYGFEIPTIPRFFVVKFNGDGNFSKSQIVRELGGSQSKTDMINALLEIAKEEGFEAGASSSNPQSDEGSKHTPPASQESASKGDSLNSFTQDLNNAEQTLDKDSKNSFEGKHRVAIIGSGPSGLTAGIYTSRAQLDTTIYLGMQPGGQLTTTTEIENFPGAWSSETKQGMMGPDLMSLIQKQAEHFGAKTRFEEVTSLFVRQENGHNKFDLTSSKGTETYDAVIIATGASARYLGLPGEEKFVGKGYHSCATCDGFFYRDKEVMIVGGGDSAMEEANFLTKFASKVYIAHRRDEFRASKIMQERALNNPNIEVLWNTVITDFESEDGNKVSGVKLQDTVTNQHRSMPIDGVFVAIGHIPNSGFVGELLDKDNAGFLIPEYRKDASARTSRYNMATKIPGIFVAGDIEDTQYRQAITAAGDGCRAAMDTEKWLEEVYG